MLGLTDENLSFDPNWLDECQEGKFSVSIIKGKLSYAPCACVKCGVKNEGQIIKNGTHHTYTQLVPLRGKKTLLKLKRSIFYVRTMAPPSMHRHRW